MTVRGFLFGSIHVKVIFFILSKIYTIENPRPGLIGKLTIMRTTRMTSYLHHKNKEFLRFEPSKHNFLGDDDWKIFII